VRLRVSIPEGAEERAWQVVRAAFEERRPVPRQRRLLRPALVLAVVAVVAGVAASPPGRAVLGSLREAVGVKKAAPALFSLPAEGKLLVVSQRGPWVVQRDGSKRLLGSYRDASWSPHGLYLTVTRASELIAVDPKGNVRWSVARRRVGFPRWTGTRTDTRIAYLSGSGLRVLAGDGTGDRAACADVVAPAAPAWRPGPGHVLAFASPSGSVYVFDIDGCRLLWRTPPGARPTSLQWSSDGKLLLVVTRDKVAVLRGGKPALVRSGRVVTAAFQPGTHELGEVRTRAGSSVVEVGGRVVFRGTGELRDLAWSPDGRWLVATWPTADQWVFVGVSGERRIRGVSGITRQFGGGSFPRLAGWCCAR
jgi:dipeptidyl aminopeptidase/acylaminoacyl peptidase